MLTIDGSFGEGRGTFRTTEISSHTRTNLNVIRQFTRADIQIAHEPPSQTDPPTPTDAWRVTVQPAR
jgi:RNA 3'-terminal phosphate cyclase